MFAQIGSTPYNVMLLIHIVASMVAFAPVFVHPLLASQTNDLGESRATIFGYLAGNGRRIYAPALIVSGLLGFGLSGMSDGIYALSQTWLLAAIILWIGMNGILHGVVIPAEKALAVIPAEEKGDSSAESKLGTGNTILSVALVIMLFLMVFKPGQ